MRIDAKQYRTTEYVEKSRMRSLLKALVISRLSKQPGGMEWYNNDAHREQVRRLVYDACEKAPMSTTAQYKLHSMADAIVKKIDADIIWQSI